MKRRWMSKKKTEKTNEPLEGSRASGMRALMDEQKEDIQGMKLYRWWEDERVLSHATCSRT